MKKRHFFLTISVRRFGMAAVLFVIAAFGLYLGLERIWTEESISWTEESISWTLPLQGEVIALDAGHGGVDPGAVSQSGILEKDITLAVTLKLRDLLTQAGAHVILLRDDDYDLANDQTKGLRQRKNEDLKARVATIKNSGARLLVSLHGNAVTSAKWTGAQTFYNSSRPDSQALATAIQQALQSDLAMTRTVQTNDAIYLLKQTPLPAALVELGFLSNPQEAEQLQSDRYQQQLALAVYHGILAYYAAQHKS